MRGQVALWLYMFSVSFLAAVGWTWFGIYPLAVLCIAGACYAAYRFVGLETE